MVVESLVEAASIVRRVCDEISSQNRLSRLIGTDCITVDPTQVLVVMTNMHELIAEYSFIKKITLPAVLYSCGSRDLSLGLETKSWSWSWRSECFGCFFGHKIPVSKWRRTFVGCSQRNWFDTGWGFADNYAYLDINANSKDCWIIECRSSFSWLYITVLRE